MVAIALHLFVTDIPHFLFVMIIEVYTIYILCVR